jgi:two-component system, NarL family, sensor kinase
VTVRREVAVSALLSTVAAACIGVGGFWAARTVATDEAIHQAEQATQMLAGAVIEPATTPGLVGGDPEAIEQLDAVIAASVLSEQIVAAKVWRDDGTVLYSDDLAGIGSQFPLSGDQQEVFARGEAHAEVSDLSNEENADQSDFAQLLEVYVAIEDPNGERLLFETYQSTARIDAATQRILRAFAPVVLGGLLLFGAIQALLNWRLARRLQGSQEERERLLARSLAASDHERRTIAADLHDGVVQDLVGVTYCLDALAVDDVQHGQELTSAANSTRRSVRSLRSLLVEIYPPNLNQVGLAVAVADLVSAGPSGVDIEVRIDPALELPERTQEAVYRAIREALSNVRRHARASRVIIAVEPAGPGNLVLTITDDGVGFDPANVEAGHVGLRLLADLADSLGGTLTVDSSPGADTMVQMVVPR